MGKVVRLTLLLLAACTKQDDFRWKLKEKIVGAGTERVSARFAERLECQDVAEHFTATSKAQGDLWYCELE